MIPLTNIQLDKEIHEIKGLNFQEVRTNDSDFFEAVLVKAVLADLTKGLEKIFGRAQFPSEKALPLEVEQKVSEFGGIRSGQALYFLKGQESILFAMLWPWQDGEHITLKIFRS